MAIENMENILPKIKFVKYCIFNFMSIYRFFVPTFNKIYYNVKIIFVCINNVILVYLHK